MADPIFHITRADDWKAAQSQGVYTADSLAGQGFIHFSTRAQLLRVAETFYKGQRGLVLLAVDPTSLSADLCYEESEPGELFPHLYGPLNLDAVVMVWGFEPGPDGLFTLPIGA